MSAHELMVVEPVPLWLLFHSHSLLHSSILFVLLTDPHWPHTFTWDAYLITRLLSRAGRWEALAVCSIWRHWTHSNQDRLGRQIGNFLTMLKMVLFQLTLFINPLSRVGLTARAKSMSWILTPRLQPAKLEMDTWLPGWEVRSDW